MGHNFQFIRDLPTLNQKSLSNAEVCRRETLEPAASASEKSVSSSAQDFEETCSSASKLGGLCDSENPYTTTDCIDTNSEMSGLPDLEDVTPEFPSEIRKPLFLTEFDPINSDQELNSQNEDEDQSTIFDEQTSYPLSEFGGYHRFDYSSLRIDTVWSVKSLD